MKLWKAELLKMNQQPRTPRLWEEDEGANYTFPKCRGVASGSWERGLQGPKSVVSSMTQKASLAHLSPPLESSGTPS